MKAVRTLKALLAAVLVSMAPLAATSAGATDVVPNRFCSVRFIDGGPTYDGIGITVKTTSGFQMVACRVDVPPPPETVVLTFPDTKGDVVVITRSGSAVLVFRHCGPSEPTTPNC
jgi:hypothetical protein